MQALFLARDVLDLEELGGTPELWGLSDMWNIKAAELDGTKKVRTNLGWKIKAFNLILECICMQIRSRTESAFHVSFA
jgi:hypothetical protein